MAKIRTFLVDDHVMLREGVNALLRMEDDIEVIGEASDGEEAIAKSAELKPDVTILDITMPGMDGLEAARHIKRGSPETKILILTQHDNKEYVISAIKAGVSGYVPKRALSSELVSAIRAVHRGQPFLYPTATTALMEELRRQSGKDPFKLLKPKQKAILTLLARGRTSRIIAEQLKLSPKTVNRHVKKLKEVLDLHCRADLVKLAVRKGLINNDE